MGASLTGNATRFQMPDSVISRQVDQRLRELYERHNALDDSDVSGYYDSVRGLLPPELASLIAGCRQERVTAP
jgi:hypothetical protein